MLHQVRTAVNRSDSSHHSPVASHNSVWVPACGPRSRIPGVLTDAKGRTQDYWRVSVTDRCNLRCTYCTPSGEFAHVPAEQLLSLDELTAIAKTARDIGVRKIKITGGEPLIRRDLCELIRELVSMDSFQDIGLTTNGILLSSLANDLRRAGLKRLNMSLDTLNSAAYREVTRRGNLNDALAGLFAALEAGLTPVKLNTVLLKGMNEPDVISLTRLTLDYPIHVRFCEQVPCGTKEDGCTTDRFTARQALAMIKREFGELEPVRSEALAGPARLYKLPNAVGAVGFIDPSAGHSCSTCNRMRLTARGTLRPCLFSPTEIDIKPALRDGASSEEFVRLVSQAVAAKPTSASSRILSLDSDMNVIGG